MATNNTLNNSLINCSGLPIPGGVTATGTASATTFLKGNGSWAPATLVTTQQLFTSGSGTYTTPANVVYIEVEMIGGGCGGTGSGAGGAGGATGGSSTFGTSLLTAEGGLNSGAVATINSPAVGYGAPGSSLISPNPGSPATGGTGAASFYGQGGAGGYGGAVGAAANCIGAGGGGAGGAIVGAQNGGACAAYLKATIDAPSATYSYAVGAGTAGGAAGVSGYAGGAGAGGRIIVREYY